jgi:uncharacterized protein YodC (DUF2158 family)
MTEQKIKSGDRVKLKSGGPTMTVSSALNDKIECSWFNEGTIQHGSFSPDTLKTFIGKKAEAAR